MFLTEQEMSEKFEKFLKNKLGNSYIKECEGLFGIPDFVFYVKGEKNVSIISFELKLKNWKQAIIQAFRYKSFSNIVYVVLPARNIDLVLEKIDLFEKYGIGLASFDADGGFNICRKPREDIPYSENLNRKLVDSIKSSRKKTKNIELLMVV